MSTSSARTALVTGGTAGIGRAIAIELAASGLTVGIVGRDATRAEAARVEIAAASRDAGGQVFLADLASLAGVRQLATDVTRAFPRLDVLVHSAAVFTWRRAASRDGLETMFATNYLAPFVLTDLLLPRLRASAPARILVLTAPSPVRLDFDDLQGERHFSGLTAFARSKAADLLFTFELARRLAGTGVTANAVHPGLVRTALMHSAPAPARWALWLVSAPPARAAKKIAPLALSPEYEGRSGGLYKDGREIDAPAYTRDEAEARKLWQVGEQLAGLRASERVTG